MSLIEATRTVPKMLIADDDPAIVRMLTERCTKLGFAVETAANGMQLLIKARRSQPDVMIVDVKMPEMDGISVCSRLLDPGSKPVEVVVITGYADPETVERCESLGLFFGRKGPDFWFSIEAALGEIYPAMMSPVGGLQIVPPGMDIPKHPRVLVVDDDQAIEVFLSSRLAKYGIDTLYASDAVHGLRIARREQPCVIIADFFMPDGDAQYLLFRLRSTLETEDIPVIVISGRPLSEVTEQTLRREICGRPGAAQIFKKSYDTAELFQALQRYCGFDTSHIPA